MNRKEIDEALHKFAVLQMNLSYSIREFDDDQLESLADISCLLNECLENQILERNVDKWISELERYSEKLAKVKIITNNKHAAKIDKITKIEDNFQKYKDKYTET